MKVLYYFRRDLRLRDNCLLKKALTVADGIAFIAKMPAKDIGQWRYQFEMEALKDLQVSLQNLNHKLHVFEDDFPIECLSSFDTLYTPLINTTYEKREAKSLSSHINVVTFFNDRLLEALPFSNLELPDVFTNFRKLIEASYQVDDEIPYPSFKIDALNVDCQELGYIKTSSLHPHTAVPLHGGETQGLQRLDDYFFKTQNILNYKKTRNELIGKNYSTKFSPYLALGCLSPKTIFREVEVFERTIKKNEDTYWVKFELWWREYFRWVYEKYGELFFFSTGIKNKEIETKPNVKVFRDWSEGKTGNAFVDANMIELNETGFMSNRGRQNVASYLVKDLRQPWQWGAQFFENNLIDYDVFSNWGNWQYIAGVGNDPRPDRYFNTQKQAETYDKDQSFRSLWLG